MTATSQPEDRDGLAGLTATPIARALRDSVKPIYSELRTSIVSNRLSVGTELNQARLATAYGVSRGPIREALRLLQAEGLIEAERNQRWRVASIDPADVETVYVQRVLIEVLGVQLTVPTMTDEELDDAADCVNRMENALTDIERYLVPHQRFHRMFVRRLPPMLLDKLDELGDRAERVQRFFASEVATSMRENSLDEHKVILAAATSRSVKTTSMHLADHYVSVARQVLETVAPEYDPKALQTTAKIARGKLT